MMSGIGRIGKESGSRVARMPTLATIKPSRRWGTRCMGWDAGGYSVIITTAAAPIAIPSPCRRVGLSCSVHAASRIVEAG